MGVWLPDSQYRQLPLSKEKLACEHDYLPLMNSSRCELPKDVI